jgi:hypothetical protein
MLKSITPALIITKNVVLGGCILNLILSAYFALKKEKEGVQKFIIISTAFAVISAILTIVSKA